MKKTILTILVLLTIFSTHTAYSVNLDDVNRHPTINNKNSTNQLEQAKKRLTNQIDKRQNSLSNLEKHLNTLKKINDSDKTEIITNIQSVYSGLETMKEEINNASDISTLKEIAQNMIYDYRIYKVRLPRERGLIAVSMANYIISTHVETVIEKLDEIAGLMEEKGQNTDALLSYINEFKTLITEAQDLLDEAQEAFSSMIPTEDTNEAESYLETGKEKLKEAKEKIKQAKSLISDIRKEIHQTSAEESNTSSPSAITN